MNGGRLSNDETFILGVEELRGILASPQPDAEAAERALTRIGLRFPEEAEQLRTQWHTTGAAGATSLLAGLDAVEAQHRADSEDE